MLQTRLSERGQVVLPKEVRDRLHLERGQEFAVEVVPDGIILRPIGTAERGPRPNWRDLEGCLAGTDAIENLMSEHQREIERGR